MFLSIVYIQLRDTWGHMWCVQWGYSFSCHGTIRNTTGGPSAWDGTLHQPWAYSPFILEIVQQYKIHTSCLKCKYSFESWNHNIHTHDYAKLNCSPESLYKQRIQTEESNGKLNSNSISLIFCFTLLFQMKKVYEKDWNKQWKVLPFYKGITNA